MKATVVRKTRQSHVVRSSEINHWLQLIWKDIESRGIKSPSATEVCCVFVGKPEAKALNEKYRQQGHPTDVLSFSAGDPTSLGDLVFCWPLIKEQSLKNEITSKQEFLYLFIHGLLHLLGYDHQCDRDAQRMYTLQDGIFNKILKTSRRTHK